MGQCLLPGGDESSGVMCTIAGLIATAQQPPLGAHFAWRSGNNQRGEWQGTTGKTRASTTAAQTGLGSYQMRRAQSVGNADIDVKWRAAVDLAEHAEFLRDAPTFERMLEEADIRLVKLWLDISKDVQAERLDARRSDPVKALKVSDLDKVAQDKWKDYTKARDEMLLATHTAISPWTIVRADEKKPARINVIRWLLHTLAPGHIKHELEEADPEIVFRFEESALSDGRLAS